MNAQLFVGCSYYVQFVLLLYVHYTHTHIYQVHFRRSSRSLFLSFYGIDLFLGLGTNPFRDTRSVSSFTTTTTTTTIYSADCNPLLLLLNSFFVFSIFFLTKAPPGPSIPHNKPYIPPVWIFLFFPLTYLLNLCDGWDETVFFFFNILMLLLLLLFCCLIFFFPMKKERKSQLLLLFSSCTVLLIMIGLKQHHHKSN